MAGNRSLTTGFKYAEYVIYDRYHKKLLGENAVHTDCGVRSPARDPMDDTDFLILNTIRRVDEPLWKRRITQYCNAQTEKYDCIEDGVSPQTVGRRVDRLEDRGFLEEYGVRPSNQSGILSAYRVTPTGEDALKEKQDTVLREYAAEFTDHVLGEDDLFSFPAERRHLLLDMLSDKFHLDLEALTALRDDMGGPAFYRAVVCSLALYYLKQYVPEHARDNPVLDLLKEESKEYADKLTTHVVPRDEEERLIREWDLN